MSPCEIKKNVHKNSILHRTTRPMLTKNQREEIALRNYVNASKR